MRYLILRLDRKSLQLSTMEDMFKNRHSVLVTDNSIKQQHCEHSYTSVFYVKQSKANN